MGLIDQLKLSGNYLIDKLRGHDVQRPKLLPPSASAEQDGLKNDNDLRNDIEELYKKGASFDDVSSLLKGIEGADTKLITEKAKKIYQRIMQNTEEDKIR